MKREDEEKLCQILQHLPSKERPLWIALCQSAGTTRRALSAPQAEKKKQSADGTERVRPGSLRPVSGSALR